MGICSSTKSQTVSLLNTQLLQTANLEVEVAEKIRDREQDIEICLGKLAPKFMQMKHLQLIRLQLQIIERRWKKSQDVLILYRQDENYQIITDGQQQLAIKGFHGQPSNLNEIMELQSREDYIQAIKDLNSILEAQENHIRKNLAHIKTEITKEISKDSLVKFTKKQILKQEYQLLLFHLNFTIYQLNIQDLASKREGSQLFQQDILQLQNHEDKQQQSSQLNQSEGQTATTISKQNSLFVIYRLLQKLMSLLKYKEMHNFNRIQLQSLELGSLEEYNKIVEQQTISHLLIKTQTIMIKEILGFCSCFCPSETSKIQAIIPSNNLIKKMIQLTVDKIMQLHHENKLDRQLNIQHLFDKILQLYRRLSPDYFQEFFEIIFNRMSINNKQGIPEVQKDIIRQFTEHINNERFVFQFQRQIHSLNLKIKNLSNQISDTAHRIDNELDKMDSNTMQIRFLRYLFMSKTDRLFFQQDSTCVQQLKEHLDQILRIRATKQNLRTIFNYLNGQVLVRYQGKSLKEVLTQDTILTYQTNLEELVVSNNQIISLYKPIGEWNGFQEDQNKLNQTEFSIIIQSLAKDRTHSFKDEQISLLAHALTQESSLAECYQKIIERMNSIQGLEITGQDKLQLQTMIKSKNLQKQFYYFQTQFIQTCADKEPILKEMSNVYKFWKSRREQLTQQYLQ